MIVIYETSDAAANKTKTPVSNVSKRCRRESAIKANELAEVRFALAGCLLIAK